MQYSVERVTNATLQEMLRFLKIYENNTLFLLNNYESYGTILTEAPYSGNFKIIRSNKEIVGVCCLVRAGTLLIETVLQETIFETLLEACQQESIPLKGLIGNWKFCAQFWKYLKANKIIQKEIFACKEILYSVELQHVDISTQQSVRFLTEEDYEQWKPLRVNYLEEEGIPNDLSDKQLLDAFLDKTRKKIAWGFFLNDSLVSIADLNAKALDLGQVGGVYTSPKFRRKGYSKAVMKQLLCDAKELHCIRKLIIFTKENNFAAQKLYTSLGATKVGHFALLSGQ